MQKSSTPRSVSRSRLIWIEMLITEFKYATSRVLSMVLDSIIIIIIIIIIMFDVENKLWSS
jgi:hypothetical protein